MGIIERANVSLSKDRGSGAGGEGVASRAKWREWVTRFNQWAVGVPQLFGVAPPYVSCEQLLDTI